MTEESTFPIFIHIITIPLTLGIGFLVGWIFRGAASGRPPRRPGGA